MHIKHSQRRVSGPGAFGTTTAAAEAAVSTAATSATTANDQWYVLL